MKNQELFYEAWRYLESLKFLSYLIGGHEFVRLVHPYTKFEDVYCSIFIGKDKVFVKVEEVVETLGANPNKNELILESEFSSIEELKEKLASTKINLFL